MKELKKKEEGVTLIEYVILAALMIVVCVVIITQLGVTVSEKLSDIETTVA